MPSCSILGHVEKIEGSERERFLDAMLQSAFQNVILFEDIAVSLGVGFVVAGVFIGVFGSMISIRKYAKV